MQFVRKIINGSDLISIIDMPNELINKKVKIFVLPIEERPKKAKKKKSIAGFLAKYANSSLMEKEENVWLEEAGK